MTVSPQAKRNIIAALAAILVTAAVVGILMLAYEQGSADGWHEAMLAVSDMDLCPKGSP